MADEQSNTTRSATRPETPTNASAGGSRGASGGASGEQPQQGGDGKAEARAPERRQNARLRLLVDEMLKSIRESQRRDDWTEAERERAEADLERIMAQVRRAAVDPDR